MIIQKGGLFLSSERFGRLNRQNNVGTEAVDVVSDLGVSINYKLLS